MFKLPAGEGCRSMARLQHAVRKGVAAILMCAILEVRPQRGVCAACSKEIKAYTVERAALWVIAKTLPQAAQHQQA
jgi:hypothetical protein